MSETLSFPFSGLLLPCVRRLFILAAAYGWSLATGVAETVTLEWTTHTEQTPANSSAEIKAAGLDPAGDVVTTGRDYEVVNGADVLKGIFVAKVSGANGAT